MARDLIRVVYVTTGVVYLCHNGSGLCFLLFDIPNVCFSYSNHTIREYKVEGEGDLGCDLYASSPSSKINRAEAVYPESK